MTMLRKASLTALAAGLLSGTPALSQDPSMTSPAATAPAGQDLSAYPLIAREALFGNPTRASAQISPDGAYLTWLAPKDGVLNIWLAPADDPDQARAITGSTDRPIRQ